MKSRSLFSPVQEGSPGQIGALVAFGINAGRFSGETMKMGACGYAHLVR